MCDDQTAEAQMQIRAIKTELRIRTTTTPIITFYGSQRTSAFRAGWLEKTAWIDLQS